MILIHVLGYTYFSYLKFCHEISMCPRSYFPILIPNESLTVLRCKESCVTFLGHALSAEGITRGDENITAIGDFAQIKDIAELRRFLGLVNFVGKFVENLAHEIKPLTELLRKDTPWVWECDQQMAFEKAKRLICRKPVLAVYDVNRATKVSADASGYGIGASISQLHGNKWKIMAYASRMLTEAEQRWSQIEKECLALVVACENFH